MHKPARFDMYATIHRALRHFMTDTLTQIGRLDASDSEASRAALDQLDTLLYLCRQHLEHENRFVHPAIEARSPGGSQRVAGEHEDHLEAIAALEAEALAVRQAPSPTADLRLYRHLALFVADNFEHMQIEETRHNELLWQGYDDAELVQIHEQILASLDPAERGLVLRWMTPALPRSERAALYAELRKQMPGEVFSAVLEGAKPWLGAQDWAALVADLDQREALLA